MKIKSGFMMREVAGTYVAVAVGARSADFHGMVNLNETGAFLWKALEQGVEREQLVQSLLDNYDVSEEQAMNDVDKFIAMAVENGFVED